MKTMKTRTVYIAGRVSGISPCEAWNNFKRAESKLEELKEFDRIINPMAICKSSWSWWLCMAICLLQLIFKANAIYLQRNWTSSRGAKIEYKVARALGKELWYE
jgi:hypothetical protein